MALTGQQIKLIRQALLDGFPKKERLEMMLRIQMNVNLDAVAEAEDHDLRTFKLITWAEMTGNVRALIDAAIAENPDNPTVKELAVQSRQWQLDGEGETEAKVIPAPRRYLALGEAAGEEPVEAPQPESSPVIDRAAELDIEWVTIPAGEFLMGSDQNKDKQAYDRERPQHKVYLPEYRIARVPVTVAQFAGFVRATDYVTAAEQKGSARNWTGEKWEDVAGTNWQHPRGPDSDVRQKQNHPVTCVSWYDAMAFCEWAGVRLPNEPEWEKAARGTDGRIWPWGNDAPSVGHCNFNNNIGDTTPTGIYPDGASLYDVLDMAGNVAEWTRSLWGPDPNTPQFGYPYRAGDGRETPNAPEAVRRTLRGGAWNYVENRVRCANRINLHPYYGGFNVGFRVVTP